MKTIFIAIIALLTLPLSAQKEMEIIESMSFRNIGPAFMTGRISDIAKDPSDQSTWYVATASSNVWKTSNSGTTWQPIFDNYGSYSTGCITIDPSNPNVIWLGTGENQSQRSVGWGDGVYKSVDGGKSWMNMGLKSSEHIGRIVIDPRNSDVVIVAAQGPLWKAGGERGIFRTVDGGKTWTQTLSVSDNTGGSEIVMDPKNPDVMYASTYQRRRHVGYLVAGGEESRVYKSTDNGKTWKKLSKGLPGGDVGRIALAVSPMKSNVVYAQLVLEERKGGFYRSVDYGESWTKTNDYAIVDPQYYGEIYCDPHRFDHVYVMDMMIHYTKDGGKSFERLNSRNKHVDNHSLLFDEDDPNYLMVGCDGGIYESWDLGKSWKYHDNLPITQFYRVGIDNDFPFYNVYGGTQDNSTIYAPSQTNTLHGITNAEWKLALGGDGFQSRIDPEDPNTVYCQSQYAGIVRYDRESGHRTELQPQVSLDEDPLRWHWDAPLIISPHNSKRLYFAAQRLFRSDDRGDTWTAISGDLSRGEDRNMRTVMGKVWQPEAVWKNVFTSPYGTIVSLSESTLREGLLVVGTDDGQIQVSENGGKEWVLYNKFPGIPEKSYVADIATSHHDPNVIIAVFNNHKEGDFKPYILKSADLGKSWKPISQGIEVNHTCWTVIEDHESPNLLFSGTEFGIYCSIDGGQNWKKMKGGLPVIPVRDLEIQQREDDLVLATFGRGMWILDDYTPLREISKARITETTVFPIKDSWVYFEKGDKGYRKKGSFGDNFYQSDNDHVGPKIRFYMDEKYTPLKAKRKKEAIQYPSYETLKKEDQEEEDKYYFLIRDANGNTINTYPIKNKSGFQEVVVGLSRKYISDDGKVSRNGPMPLAGSFTAELMKAGTGGIKSLSTAHPFKTELLSFSDEKPASDYYAFYSEVTENLVKALAIRSQLETLLKTQPLKKEQYILENEADKIVTLDAKRRELLEIKNLLNGDETLIKRSEYHHRGIISRLNNLYWNMWQSMQITNTHRDQLKKTKIQLSEIMKSLEE